MQPTPAKPLETWLSFIQPWRYASPQIRHGDRHKSPSQGVEAHWQPFVQEHLLFYTELLGVFLPRFFRMDLASRYCAFTLYRVTKVLFQPNLFAMITEAEASLGSAGQSASPVGNALQRQAVSAPVATLVRQHMADIEEPGFVYRPLNGEERRKELNKDTELSTLPLNGYEPVSLFASSRDVTDSIEGQNGFRQCLDNTKAYNYHGNPDTEPIRSYEVVFLVRMLHLLSTAINDKSEAGANGFSCAPELIEEDIGAEFSGCDELCNEVHKATGCVSDTEDGEIAFEEYALYEADLLVTGMLSGADIVEMAVNDADGHADEEEPREYGPQLQGLYGSSRFVGHVARLLLQPPTVYTEVVKRGVGTPYDYRQHRLPARVCLRTLAHKQFIVYLCVLLFLGYTWDYGPFTVCLIVLECFSISLLFRATWSWGVERLQWRQPHQAVD
ncbi:hypothetical protein HPB52_000906 [Rhipicephalus sanguineus]|uniref:Sphingomyelin phosphodiesterase 4 n=1 Tax=Rhipicephalus sanguineus TaxID=34632 RepID=A0A9D4PTL2_RHISA|nr:hypothetical protein HPB52_000906 [Rhipicephalus sanguineus]